MKNIIPILRKQPKRAWQQPYKWPYLILILVLVSVIVLLNSGGEEEVLPEKTVPQVSVQTLSELQNEVAVVKTGSIEPAVSAPLIARTGGRVTKLNYELGDTVNAGTTVVSIDTGAVANPTRTQAAGLNNQLAVLDKVETATVEASDIAITIAKLNLDAATANRSLTSKQVASVRDSANVAKKTAEEARDFAQSDDLGDLAVESATLALDQAKISQSLTVRGGNDALQQARQGLKNAEVAKQSALASLASSRQQLITSRDVAAASAKLQQVVAPVNGQVTKLNVRLGSYVNPGQVIGEVNATEGAQVSVDVSAAVHAQLELGQVVPLAALNQNFAGTITALSREASFQNGLWQVDIFVTSTPEIIHPGELVTVQLPAAPQLSDDIFVPLDMAVVREDGVFVFTLEDGKAVAHQLQVIGFVGQYIEAKLELPLDAKILTSGVRILQDGETVEVK